MIPRTRVNFTAADLARAALVDERSDEPKTRLRSQIATYHGADDAILTPSGRCALYTILKALDRPRVIVPAYTCNAVIEAALHAKKEIVYTESSEGFNASADAIGDLADKDSVVLATHQFGIPCDIERIVKVAHDKGALVVEDAAASLGTRVGGRLTGTFGDAAFFSFDISKLVSVPLKGGAILARDPALFAHIRATYMSEIEPMPPSHKAKLLASAAVLLGIAGPHRYRLFHTFAFGPFRGGKFTAESATLNRTKTPLYQYDLTNWQASIAIPQMARIDTTIAARRRIYAEYERRLAGASAFDVPPRDTHGEWACIRFPIRVHEDKIEFYRHAARRGVDFAFSFTFIAAPPRFETAHRLANTVLDLPFYSGLEQREIDETVATVMAVAREWSSRQRT